MPFTFVSSRMNLNDMAPNDQRTLADRIKGYATDDIVRQHHLHNGAHGLVPSSHGHLVPEGSGRDFFEWHREYLGSLERALSIRLPYWRPWTEIPQTFLEPADQRGNVHNPTPPVSSAEFLLWSHELVGFFRDADAMGSLLTWGPHFKVHLSCGGDMAAIERAPAAPIFWPWHTFIDDIYEDWLQQRYKRVGPLAAPSWPWVAPQSPHAAHAHPAFAPFCYGLKRNEAEDLIRDHGLQVGEVRDLPHIWHRVVSQQPLPFSLLAPASPISISGRVEADWVRPE
ncbi:tyrosinase family protein [Candidatus Poribacteria bacterium]|nr:tyrosinase family protein [Candidatus Poribacteria bacterium]